MTKLNTGRRLQTAPLQTEKVPTGTTHLGAPGYEREIKTQLFMGCTTTFAGEGAFHETAEQHDTRMIALAREIAVTDFKWIEGFLPWLRKDAFIRTSAVMLAAEVAHALNGKDHMTKHVARVVDGSMARADEVTEIVAYCLSHFGVVPVGVRKGCELAMLRMWRERAVMRWDKPERPVRFADVIEIVHPNPTKVQAPRDLVLTHQRYEGWHSADAARDYELGHAKHLDALFRYLLDERHHNDRSHAFTEGEDGRPVLPGIAARIELAALTPKERHAFAARALDERGGWEDRKLKRAAAGQWEFIKSWLGEGVKSAKGLGDAAERAFIPLTDRQQWELVFPWMGYEAVLKNLSNMEEAGITRELVRKVQDFIADPEQVKNSRQLPFRFLTAHLNTKGAHWLGSLEEALQLSLPNVPYIPGRGLIMIDMSGSMLNTLSKPNSYTPKKGDPVIPNRLQAAALFAMALALRNAGRVSVFGFADPPGFNDPWTTYRRSEKKWDGHVYFEGIEPGASLLRLMQVVVAQVGTCGYGTALEQNLRQCYDPTVHEWVGIFSDEQCLPGTPDYGTGMMGTSIGDITRVVPAETPVFAWNLAGYSHGAFPTGGRRYSLAGLDNSSFEMMRRLMVEGKSAKWPWE